MKYIGELVVSSVAAKSPMFGKPGIRVMASQNGRMCFYAWGHNYTDGIGALKCLIANAGLSADLVRDRAGSSPMWLWSKPDNRFMDPSTEFIGAAHGFDYYINLIDGVLICKDNDGDNCMDVLTLEMAQKIVLAPGNEHVKLGWTFYERFKVKKAKEGKK